MTLQVKFINNFDSCCCGEDYDCACDRVFSFHFESDCGLGVVLDFTSGLAICSEDFESAQTFVSMANTTIRLIDTDDQQFTIYRDSKDRVVFEYNEVHIRAPSENCKAALNDFVDWQRRLLQQ